MSIFYFMYGTSGNGACGGHARGRGGSVMGDWEAKPREMLTTPDVFEEYDRQLWN